MAGLNSLAVISAGTHNAVAFGIATQYTIEMGGVPLPVKEQGEQLDAAIGFVGKSITAVVTYVAGAGAGFIAHGTKGTLSFTVLELTGGGSKTVSCANMKCISCVLSHTDRNLGFLTATFMVEDAADNTSASIA